MTNYKLQPYDEAALIEDIEALAKEDKGIRTGRFKTSVYPKPATKAEAKSARARLKLSQAKFALLLGVSTSTVKAWEQGWRRPDGLATKVLRLLKKDPGYAQALVKV